MSSSRDLSILKSDKAKKAGFRSTTFFTEDQAVDDALLQWNEKVLEMTHQFSVEDFVLSNDVEEKKEKVDPVSGVAKTWDVEAGNNVNVNNPTDGYYDEDEEQFKAKEKSASPSPKKKDLKPSKFDRWGSVQSRNKFISKVFIIVMSLLLYNFCIMCLFIFIKPLKDFAIEYWWLSLVFSLCFIIFALVLSCVPGVSRKVPANYILLAICATFLGLSLGCISAYYDIFTVLLAVGVTACVVLLLAIIAIFSKCDFTMCIGIVAVCVFCFMIFGLFMIFFQSRILDIVYCSIGTLIASILIVIDIQMICGGKNRKIQYAEEDYAIAALSLYVDIAFLLIMIMGLSGAAK